MSKKHVFLTFIHRKVNVKPRQQRNPINVQLYAVNFNVSLEKVITRYVLTDCMISILYYIGVGISTKP